MDQYGIGTWEGSLIIEAGPELVSQEEGHFNFIFNLDILHFWSIHSLKIQADVQCTFDRPQTGCFSIKFELIHVKASMTPPYLSMWKFHHCIWPVRLCQVWPLLTLQHPASSSASFSHLLSLMPDFLFQSPECTRLPTQGLAQAAFLPGFLCSHLLFCSQPLLILLFTV